MKRNKLFLIACAALLFSSCKKWLDINEDPANPQVATGEVLLAPIQFQMANNVANDSRYIGKYVQFWGNQAINDVWERHGYVSDVTDISGSIWRMIYFNHGRNLELMIKDGVENQKYGFAGIGYAIKAWAYQTGADYHGPLIVDEAYDESKYVFNYNDQPYVYTKVREWCHQAITYLDKTDGKDVKPFLATTSGDQIYKGDLIKWKKFVYGILALQFSHLRNKAEFSTAYADSVIKYAELSFADAGDDASVFFNASVAAENNPLASLTGSTVYRIANPIVALLTGGVRGTPAATPTTSVDPRLTRMLTPSTDGVYRGVVATDGDPNATNTSRRIAGLAGAYAAPFPGKYVFSDKARFPLMSYAQIQFAKAEAALVKTNSALAHTAYLNGIRGHMDFTNRVMASWASAQAAISATETTAYLASTEVAQTPAALTIADIMQQKYIAQWGWATIEQWTDLRKYNYNTNIFKYYNIPTVAELWPENNGKPVQRVRPRFNSEYVWNRATLETFGGLNPDYHTYELWFTKP